MDEWCENYFRWAMQTNRLVTTFSFEASRLHVVYQLKLLSFARVDVSELRLARGRF
jgi:hypothetical protein